MQSRHIWHWNDSRRGNYRCQNYNSRNDSRDRGDKTLGEVSIMIIEAEAQHQEEMVTEGIIAQMQI